MIGFSCPRCGRKYHADEAHAGKNIRCTACGDIVQIDPQDGGYRIVDKAIQATDGHSVNLGRAVDSFTSFKCFQRALIGWRWSIAALFLVVLVGFGCFQIGKAHQESASDGFVPDKQQTKTPDSSPVREAVEPDGGKEPAAVKLNSADVDITSGLIAKQPQGPSKMIPLARKQRAPEDVDADAALHPRDEAPPVINGARVIPDLATAGHGELEAINGTDHDAYVLVIDVRRDLQVRWILIRRGLRVTLDGLDPGDYRVVFATGLDWNETTRKFNSNADYFQMGRNLSFQEIRNVKGIEYDHHSITLYPVPDGNIRMIQLTEAQFRALSGKQ